MVRSDSFGIKWADLFIGLFISCISTSLGGKILFIPLYVFLHVFISKTDLWNDKIHYGS